MVKNMPSIMKISICSEVYSICTGLGASLVHRWRQQDETGAMKRSSCGNAQPRTWPGFSYSVELLYCDGQDPGVGDTSSHIGALSSQAK